MTKKTVFKILIVIITIVIWTLVILQIIHISNNTTQISNNPATKHFTLPSIDRKNLIDPFSGRSAQTGGSGIKMSGPIQAPSVLLKGILSDEAHSKAIIAQHDGTSKMMTAGENIGAVILLKIESDHVIIQENNRRYKIYADRWEEEK